MNKNESARLCLLSIKMELLDELQANHVGCEWGEY